MVHITYRRGLFARAAEYIAACRLAHEDNNEMSRVQGFADKLIAAGYRESARALRDSGEANTSDPALLLEQMADALDPVDPPLKTDSLENPNMTRTPTQPITHKERTRH